MMKSYWTKVGSKFKDCCPSKERHRDTHREDHVKTEAETGAMQLMPKDSEDCRQPAETRRRQGGGSL